MNTLNHTSLIKKLAVLVAVTGVSGSISLPVLAQVNPHPSIFNEPPYNHSYSPRPGHRPRHRPKHRPDPLLGQGPAEGGPPPAPRLGRPPAYGPQGSELPDGGPRRRPAPRLGRPPGYGPQGGEPPTGGPPPAQRPGDQPGYGPQGGEPPTGGPPPVPPADTPPG